MEKMDGHFLRKLREERGWSLREFAEKIYTSKSTVQRWEQSSPPGDEETRARIAEAFGMSEEDVRLFVARRREENVEMILSRLRK